MFKILIYYIPRWYITAETGARKQSSFTPQKLFDPKQPLLSYMTFNFVTHLCFKVLSLIQFWRLIKKVLGNIWDIGRIRTGPEKGIYLIQIVCSLNQHLVFVMIYS